MMRLAEARGLTVVEVFEEVLTLDRPGGVREPWLDMGERRDDVSARPSSGTTLAQNQRIVEIGLLAGPVEKATRLRLHQLIQLFDGGAAEKLGVSSSILHPALRAQGGGVPEASFEAGCSIR
ncbi:hypothetical protein WMF30_42610 [Sorangium sp. So ce134]